MKTNCITKTALEKNYKISLSNAKRMITLILLLFSIISFGQNIGDYQSKATGNWNAVATWETWNGSAWVESGTPTSANGLISILDGHTVTVTADVTVDQVVIEAGGQVTLLGGNLTVSNGPGDDFVINGIYRRTSTFSTMSLSSGAVVRCENGGIYEHSIGGSGGSVPTITWNANSILRISNNAIMSSAPTGLNQTFGIVEINIPAQTSNWPIDGFTDITNELRIISTGSGYIRLNSTKSITGSFVQSGGRFINSLVNSSTTFTIGGNLTISGGEFDVSANTSTSYLDVVVVNGNIIVNGGAINLQRSNNVNAGRLFVKGNLTVSSGEIARTQTVTDGTTGIYFDGTVEQTFNWSGGTINGQVLKRFYYKTTSGPTALNEIYSATVAQTTINGSESTPIAGYAAWPTTGSLIKNLTIDNPAGVTLSTNKTVNETLTLTNGVFTLSNTLTMANGASIVRSGGSLSAAPTFVEQVNVTYAENETAITTGFELPPSNNPSPLKDLTINNAVILNNSTTVDGNLHINAPLNLNDKTITCSNNITTTSTSRIVGNGTLGGGVKLTNNGTIAPGNSIGTITVEGDYEATETANHEFEIEGVANDKLEVTGEVFLAGSLLITDISSEEDPALAESYTFITGSSIDGSFEEDNITLPEGFIINSEETGIFQMVLPVELISFTAREKPQGVWLLWSTASERDSKSFTIEKSSDGRNWFAIGEVEAAGYSDVLRNYQFLDSNPLFGWQYYRLLQKDWDGKSAYYGPVSFFSNAAAGSLEVFPTVFDDQLNLRMQAKGQQAFHFTIRNAMGQALQEGTLAGNGEETTIETRGWPIGGYFVQIYTAQSPLKTLKVFKIQ